jgi:protein-tyrosine kinase
MGKISDALERHQKEREIKTEQLPLDRASLTGKEKIHQPPVDMTKLMSKEYINPKLVILHAPDSIDAENFKILRGQLIFAKDSNRPRLIMVTSTFPGEGKTFVAANLAASIAQGIDEYVLVVDCDLRRPSLHTMFGFSNRIGLTEYLSGERDLTELFIRTNIKKLSLLCAGQPSVSPSELLASKRMKAFLNEIKNRYNDRFIILDTSPSQVLAEANVLANYMDGIVLVVMGHKTPRGEVHKSIDAMGKEKILGIVFNGYGQSYKAYGKYYKKYY